MKSATFLLVAQKFALAKFRSERPEEESAPSDAKYEVFDDLEVDMKMITTCVVCLVSVVLFLLGTTVFKQIKQNYEMIKMVLLLQIPVVLLYLYDQGYLNIRPGRNYHRQSNWSSRRY